MAARRLSALADHARADLGARRTIRPIDYQDAYYYSAPKNFKAPKSLDDIDPEILKTYEKLGIPLREREALLGIVREPVEGEEGEAPAQPRRGRCRVRFASRSRPPSRKS